MLNFNKHFTILSYFDKIIFMNRLKGFRDFLPQEAKKREFVKNKIAHIFKIHGFSPIETPTIEYASLLLGKYGQEADKLLYLFKDNGGRDVGLRYDQTVPSARFIATYQNDLTFPFFRYQIQNVFRAEKPQKGRYREFTQCDIDIFKAPSPLSDAIILKTVYDVLTSFDLNINILINHRQTLVDSLKPFENNKVSVSSIITSLDKLDKKDEKDVKEELIQKGLEANAVENIFKIKKNYKINDELKQIIDKTIELGVSKEKIIVSPFLARGLDYYTGMIFEVKIKDSNLSLAGGGRYDTLIKTISGQDISAVGAGIGFDRLVDIIDIKNKQNIAIFITIFDKNTEKYSLDLYNFLVQNNIPCFLNPSIDKLKKQIKLASKMGTLFTAIIGPDEIKSNTIILKNMQTHEQKQISKKDILNFLKTKI